MNLKRAIVAGIVLWVVIFFEVSILMFGFGLSSATSPALYYSIHYVFLALITSIGALIYFRGKKTKKNIGEGFLLGLVLIITGIILDAAITIPLFVHNYAFFLDKYLLIGFLEGILICMIVPLVKKK